MKDEHNFKKIDTFFKHPLWDAFATWIKKFKSSKSYWSVSFLVILFTLREATAWKYGSAIEAYAQKQLEGSDFAWLWTAVSFVFDIGGSWELVLLGVLYFIILSYVKVNSAEKDEIVKVVKEESSKTHQGIDEIKELIKSHGINETDFLKKYFGKDYTVILKNPQTYHNFTTLLKQTNKNADELLQEREELLKKIASQSFHPALQKQIDKAFRELRYEDARELIDSFLEANADKEKEIIKAHYLKALSYMEQIRYHDAKDEFEKIGLNIDDVNILFDYAEIYSILDKNDKALEILHAIQMREDDSFYLAILYENIGVIYHKKGEYKEAVKYYLAAIEKKKEVFGEMHSEVGTSFNNMGLLMYDIGEFEEAINFYYIAVSILLQTTGENNLRMSSTYSNLGMALSEIGDFTKAKEYYKNSLNIIVNHYDNNHIETAKVYNNLALTLKREENHNEAIIYYQKALNLQIKFLGQNHSDVGITYANIGSVFYTTGRYKKAIRYYEKSLRILHNVFQDHHPIIEGIQGNMQSAEESLRNAN